MGLGGRPISQEVVVRSVVGNLEHRLDELGYPNVQSSAWTGLMAPAGTPRQIIAKIQHDAQSLLRSEEFKSRIAAMANDVLDLPSEQFADFVKQEAQSWGEIARRVGAKID
jgi:tripartite-type tricarboxylate transporter receptor subunit TctC